MSKPTLPQINWRAADGPKCDYGNLSGMPDDDIKLAIDCDIDDFIIAASEVGFIDGEEGKRTLHGWKEHQRSCGRFVLKIFPDSFKAVLILSTENQAGCATNAFPRGTKKSSVDATS